jgi:hypothetical protein
MPSDPRPPTMGAPSLRAKRRAPSLGDYGRERWRAGSLGRQLPARHRQLPPHSDKTRPRTKTCRRLGDSLGYPSRSDDALDPFGARP